MQFVEWRDRIRIGEEKGTHSPFPLRSLDLHVYSQTHFGGGGGGGVVIPEFESI